MDERYMLRFAERLRELGFPELMAEQMERFTDEPGVLLPLRHRALHDLNVVNYTVFAYRAPDDWRFEYEIARIDVSLRRSLDIQDVVVNGIDVRDLDKRMAAEQWSEEDRFTERHRELARDLWKLSENRHPIGIQMREKLVLKHLSDTDFGAQLPQIEAIRARHEIQRSFNAPGQVGFSAIQMYNLLDGRPVAVDMQDEFGTSVTKWIGADSTLREISGGPVLTVYERSEEFDVKAALLRTRYAEFLSDQEIADAVESFKAGNSTSVGASMVGRDDEVRLLAEPWNDRVREDYRQMKALGLLAEETVEDRIAHQTADKEELIANLEKNLIALGFGGVNREELRSAIFFGDREFELKCDLTYGPNKLRCRIEIEYRDGFEQYDVRSVHASLRKEIKLPAETKSGTEMEEIERRFTEINWEQADFMDARERKIRRLDTVERGVQLKVDDLLEYLSRESFLLPDGLTLQQKLLYKYWSDTPNERYIPDFGRVNRALTYDAKFDQFTFMHVNAEEIYRLLSGQVVPRNIDELGDDTLHRGYLVMHEIGNSRFVQWLPGPTEHELIKQLEDRVPMFRTSHDRSEVVKDLFDGKEVLFAEMGDKIGHHLLRLAKDDWRVSLSIFPETDRYLSDEAQERLGKLADRLRSMGFGESANIVFRMFENHIGKFTLERVVERRGRAKIKANIEFSESGRDYLLSSVEIGLINDINIPLLHAEGIEDVEAEMRSIDWTRADYNQWGKDLLDVTPAGEWTPYMHAADTLHMLGTILYMSENPVDKWKAEALVSKYLLFTPSETFTFDKDLSENRFLVQFKFSGGEIDRLNMKEMFNLVHGRAVFSDVAGSEGEEWFKIDFGSPTPELTKVVGPNIANVLGEVEMLKGADGFEPGWVIESLRHGNVIAVHVMVDDHVLRIPIFLDPSKQKLVVVGNVVSEEVQRFLDDHPNWEHRQTWREIGQARDFYLHPATVEEKEMRNVMGQLEAWGFDMSGEEQVKTALQVGYSEFTIDYVESLGEGRIKAAVAFGPTGLMDPSLVGYRFSLETANGQTVSFEVGQNDLPLMTLHSARNLAEGRPVHLPEDSLAGHWYCLEKSSGAESYGKTWQRVTFQALELVQQIDKMPIKMVHERATRSRIFSALMRGNPAPVIWIRDGQERPGELVFDLTDRKVKMSFTDGGLAKGREQHPDEGEGEGRGSGRGLR